LPRACGNDPTWRVVPVGNAADVAGRGTSTALVDSLNNEQDKRYVLVIKSCRVAYGPIATRDEAEYAAIDYYGTAITGASANDEFLIVELRSVDDDAIRREHDRHVRALMASDT
jgi:hypothetical protein